jgi:hypothetical protein
MGFDLLAGHQIEERLSRFGRVVHGTLHSRPPDKMVRFGMSDAEPPLPVMEDRAHAAASFAAVPLRRWEDRSQAGRHVSKVPF